MWLRRFANPNRRDYLLGALFLGLVLVAVLAFTTTFRIASYALAAELLVLAAIRALPTPLGSAFKVRTKTVDIVTLVVLAASIGLLAIWVPGSR